MSKLLPPTSCFHRTLVYGLLLFGTLFFGHTACAQVDVAPTDSTVQVAQPVAEEPGMMEEEILPDTSGTDPEPAAAEVSEVIQRINTIEAYVKENLANDKPDGVMLSIGGEFDFLEKVSVNGLYFDINYYVPKVSEKLSCLKLEGRASQGALSKGIFFEAQDSGLVATGTLPDGAYGEDSTRYLVERYRLNRTFSPKYAFMQFDALWSLTDRQIDKDEFDKEREPYRSVISAILPFTEYYVYALQTTTMPRLLTRDTLLLPSDSTITTIPYRFFNDGVEESDTRRTHAINLGVGAHYRYSSPRTLILMRAVVGRSWVARQSAIPFYMVNFEYTSVKQGIKFGAEVRGSFGKSLSLGTMTISEPTAHFYIAKTFGGGAIAKFITQ